MGIGIIFFYSAASAIFLIEFDAETLPYAFIASAFLIPIIGLLFSQLEQKLPVTRLFYITLGLVFGSILVSRMLLAVFDSRWPAFGLFIWAHVIFVLCYLEFWGLVGRCFNVRQGKRLFGLVGTGEVAAIIISGFAVPAMVEWVGAPNLLAVSAAGIVLCFPVLAYIFRLSGSSFNEEKNEDQTGKVFQELRKNRYMTLTAVLWVLSVSAFYFLDFAFFQQAETRYTNEDDLAGFFGMLLGFAGVATLFSRLFVSGPLLNRFGITAGLLALPVVLTLGSGVVVLGNFVVGAGVLFWMVITIRVLDEVIRTSIEEPSKRVLYQPLPIDKRISFQTLVEGLTEPVAGGMAGAILLLFITVMDFKTVHAVFILLCIGGVWIGVVLALSREYKKALLEALTKRTLGDVKVSLIDASSVEILKKGLSHSKPGVVVYCLNMLQEMEHPLLEKYLLDLLDNPHWQIRLEALQRIENLRLRSALEGVRQRMEAEEITRIKGVALRVLCELEDEFSYEQLAPYMDAKDPDIRKGVLVGLLRNGGIEETRFAESRLMDSIKSPNWKDRLFGAQVLGETDSSDFHEPLLGLLHDEHLEVRKAALEASGRLKVSHLWPGVLENLENPQTRMAAFSALVSGGETAIPFLEKKFNDNNTNQSVLVQISRVFGKIGGNGALEALAKNHSFPIEEVRHQIIFSLAMFNYQAPEDRKESFLRNMHREIENATWILAALVEMDGGNHSNLLKRALSNAWLNSRERILLLLSFIYPSREILRIRANLTHHLAEQRAYALEALEHILHKDSRKIISPLMDEFSPEERLKKLSARFPQEKLTLSSRLAAIISRPVEYSSIWTKACALYLAGKTDTFNHYDVIVDALSCPEPIIRETAACTLYSLNTDLFRKHETQIKKDCQSFADQLVQGDGNMLLTIEKTILLHETDIFSETPEELLVNVASILKEIDIKEGETIIQKGSMGSSMFIIVEGKVKVHDEDHAIATLCPSEVFGELAALDPEPRMASVTALEDTKLFKIEQDIFYEMMAEHINVARGIMRVLCQRLRNK